MVKEFVLRLGYDFTNQALLTQALTHPSMDGPNYERLEFLGDRVLALIIAELLYDAFPKEAEGKLAKRHAALVCGQHLAHIANILELGSAMILLPGEEQMGGRENAHNLENTLEAVIGALFLDSDFATVKRVVGKWFLPYITKMDTPPQDAKSQLQEWLQGQKRALPVYRVIKEEGPSHAPVFTVELKIKGFDAVTGTGSSKKKAELEVAKVILQHIQEGS